VTILCVQDLAAHYTAVHGKPYDPYELLSDIDPTISHVDRGGGFLGYYNRFRHLIWIFCGQPGRLSNTSFALSTEAKCFLCRLGGLDLADELNGLLHSLDATVIAQSFSAGSRWGDAQQMRLVPGPAHEPFEGAFWRRVFTTFRGEFVINPPTDIRLKHEDLKKRVQERRSRLHLPKRPVSKALTERAQHYQEDLMQTVKLLEKGYAVKRVAQELGVSQEAIYYRRRAARKRGLLAP
jgi:hypothetical protein